MSSLECFGLCSWGECYGVDDVRLLPVAGCAAHYQDHLECFPCPLHWLGGARGPWRATGGQPFPAGEALLVVVDVNVSISINTSIIITMNNITIVNNIVRASEAVQTGVVASAWACAVVENVLALLKSAWRLAALLVSVAQRM